MPKLAKQQHDVHSLGNVLEDLTKITNDLMGLIESMKGNQVDAVEVRYHKEMLRALKYLPRFVSDGQHEVRQHLIQSQDRYRPSAERKSPEQMEDEIEKVRTEKSPARRKRR